MLGGRMHGSVVGRQLRWSVPGPRVVASRAGRPHRRLGAECSGGRWHAPVLAERPLLP